MAKLLILITFFFSSFSLANIRGSDLQNFNPTYSGLDFVTVHSSETLDPLRLNFGFFANYSTNSLSYFTSSAAPNNQTFAEPNDRLLYSNLGFGLGLMQGWDFGLAAGFLSSQDVDQSNFLASYGDPGINDVMLTTKIRILNEQRWGLSFVGGIDFDQIKNNPFAGSDPGPSVSFSGIFDYHISQSLLWALNLGYRVRSAGEPINNTGVTPMSDQILYSSAVSYRTDQKGSAVIGELFGSVPTQTYSIPTDRALSNLELQLSYRWSGLEFIDIHGGFGTEAYHGLGSPDFRIFLGVNFNHGFLQNTSPSQPLQYNHPRSQPTKDAHDQDGDGVPDPIDQCENTLLGVSVDERGCEFKTSSGSHADEDGDGVTDSEDQCQQTAPSTRVNSFGCAIRSFND